MARQGGLGKGLGALIPTGAITETPGGLEEIPVASLAKRFEEVYVPGQADPVEVPRQSEALFLLQRSLRKIQRIAEKIGNLHRALLA